MNFTVDKLVRAASAALPPGLTGEERATGWSVDTRTLAAGDLFFGLRGPNHDGGQYAGAALERGAVAAVAERAAGGAKVIAVPDARRALADIASWARRQWSGEVIGVTGSAGKTSTKDIVAELLSEAMPVGKTVGNLNNEIGVPLSVLRLEESARAAVLEMGMNHAGEIRALAAVARPSIGVVTNVGTAHIENFDSIEGIALAKRELVEALPKEGVAVLNADDARVAGFAAVHPGRSVLYGLSEEAEVRPEEYELGPDRMRFRFEGQVFESALAGEHSLRNILAGLAVARLFGIGAGRLRERIAALRPVKMRGERFVHRGILVLNDCYNSNPDAARAMIDVLAAAPAARRIAVMGEMLELGRWSESLHRDVGIHAARKGIAVLIGIRGAARAMVDASVEAGLERSAAVFFDEPEPAGEYARSVAAAGDAILFKGSRGTRVERALERFMA